MAYPVYTAQVLLFMGYSLEDFIVSASGGLIDITQWYHMDPKPTDTDILDNGKEWAGSVKKEEIYREQEIRSYNITVGAGETLGVQLPRTIINLLEETYLKIIKAAARNAIDEVETPIWWGIQQLRNNRNTLLNGLDTWMADPTKTADDILAFDVSGWGGWVIDRPADYED